MYKLKLFARHPKYLMKSNGSFKNYKSGSKKSKMDDYLLSLVKGVAIHTPSKSKSKTTHSGGSGRKKYEPLKFIR